MSQVCEGVYASSKLEDACDEGSVHCDVGLGAEDVASLKVITLVPLGLGAETDPIRVMVLWSSRPEKLDGGAVDCDGDAENSDGDGWVTS